MTRKELTLVLSDLTGAYIFLYLDVHLGRLNVLPNWVCFYLIIKALPMLAKSVPSAALLDPLASILTAYWFLDWILAFVGLSLDHHLLTLIVAVLTIYLNFQLLTNVAEAIVPEGVEGERKLLNLRTLLTLFSTLAALPIPWESYPSLKIVLGVLALLVSLWVIRTLRGLRKKIEATLEPPEPGPELPQT